MRGDSWPTARMSLGVRGIGGEVVLADVLQEARSRSPALDEGFGEIQVRDTATGSSAPVMGVSSKASTSSTPISSV